MSKLIAGAIYRHYKGGLYQIIDNAFEEHTKRRVVVYRQLTPNQYYPSGTVWTRPLEEFSGLVDDDKGAKQRFEWIPPSKDPKEK